jgi:hypothetical protein
MGCNPILCQATWPVKREGLLERLWRGASAGTQSRVATGRNGSIVASEVVTAAFSTRDESRGPGSGVDGVMVIRTISVGEAPARSGGGFVRLVPWACRAATRGVSAPAGSLDGGQRCRSIARCGRSSSPRRRQPANVGEVGWLENRQTAFETRVARARVREPAYTALAGRNSGRERPRWLLNGWFPNKIGA